MECHTAYVTVNGKLIVIENDDHRLLTDSRVIETFVGNTAGSSPVTDQCRDLVLFVLQGPCPCHTKGNGYRTGRMSRHKRVCIAFAGFGESGDTAELPQMCKFRLATGQQLMDIRLMADVENQTVHTGIIHRFQSNGELYNAKIGGNVTAGLGYIGN